MWLLDLLFPPRVDEELLRPETISTFAERMRPVPLPHLSVLTTALMPFSDQVVRAALHEAKYHASSHAYVLLTAVLSEYLRDMHELAFSLPTTKLIPVPLGKKRVRVRGGNQVAAVTERCAKDIELTHAPHLLERVRDTVSQVTLSREERILNMKDAFRATQDLDPHCLYILVDDVVTTGATLEATAQALRAAGATQLYALALAH